MSGRLAPQSGQALCASTFHNSTFRRDVTLGALFAALPGRSALVITTYPASRGETPDRVFGSTARLGRRGARSPGNPRRYR